MDFEQIARTAVAEAGTLLRARWRGTKTVQYKGAVDLVTETDREAEELIVNRLRHALPDHLIVAEEASAGTILRPPANDRYVWYLDPLDGTTNFAHGYPQFCVSLALAQGTEVLFGIVYDPVREEAFVGRRGRGATLNGEPIRVSAVDDLQRALLGTGFAYDRQVRTDFYLSFVRDFMRQAQDFRRAGSAALDLCYVACGRFDGFFEWNLRPWDTAAGTLIVREAGGKVSDFRGGSFDLYGEHTLASNGHLHAAMVSVLRARLERSAD
ncbi:MAG TPA: inositol monophosphatase family protein [Candidatus Margulisiibacteriota bacterium]|nr:inositol monophosphatase family protein [Candidatus Margulisiibacteriota bacterium]